MVSFYEITIPVFIKQITTLRYLLTKGIADAKVADQTLLDARLISDMGNLIYQSMSPVLISYSSTPSREQGLFVTISNYPDHIHFPIPSGIFLGHDLLNCLFFLLFVFPVLYFHVVTLGSGLRKQILTVYMTVQRVSDTAKGVAVRVGKVPNVALADEEKTFPELLARLDTTLKILESVKVWPIGPIALSFAIPHLPGIDQMKANHCTGGRCELFRKRRSRPPNWQRRNEVRRQTICAQFRHSQFLLPLCYRVRPSEEGGY
jgi:hypothetical protein